MSPPEAATPSGAVEDGGGGRTAPHEPTLRTDFASIVPLAVTTSVGGRGDTGNSRRDAAARRATTRRDAEADEDAPLACWREIYFPDLQELRFEVAPGERGGQVTLKGNQAHGRNGRRIAGNGGGSQRTRQRSKALKSAAPCGRG